VTFRVAALRDTGVHRSGRLRRSGSAVARRTITVQALVPNPGRELQAGRFIEARLATAVRPNAVIVPEDAVLPIEGNTFACVVSGGKATRRQIELGVRTPGFVEVKSASSRETRWWSAGRSGCPRARRRR